MIGLGHAFVASAPHDDRRMIAEAQDGVARVVEKQRWILGLDVVVLRGFPEVVPHHQSVFVREIVEGLLGVLADPVADDVQVSVAMQPEKRLQMLAGDAFARIVHAPITAAAGDAHAVDFDHQVG